MISAVQFDIRRLILFWRGINAKTRASSEAKLLIGHRKQKSIIFAEAGDGEIRRLVDNSAQRKMKICKIYRNDLRALALKNNLEGSKMNKLLSGLLAGILEDNVMGWKIGLKISQSP